MHLATDQFCVAKQSSMADQEDEDLPNEDLCQATYAARAACWKAIGQLDTDVLGHVINPTFMGGPKWPALRQAFAIIRRPETQTVVLASDGLADPWDGPC